MKVYILQRKAFRYCFVSLKCSKPTKNMVTLLEGIPGSIFYYKGNTIGLNGNVQLTKEACIKWKTGDIVGEINEWMDEIQYLVGYMEQLKALTPAETTTL